MRVTCCSDLHHGPVGHPANDETPGWAEAWAAVPQPKYRLGDMDELWQFNAEEIGELAWTNVYGNHDRRPRSRAEICINDTIFVHGHQFDPRAIRWLGRPACWLVGRLERWWPDADMRLGAWLQKRFGGGRHGEAEVYARKAAEYAVKRAARQIVFGHLHQRFELMPDGELRSDSGRRGMRWKHLALGVHVVCTGCCCNGRMDFVEVEV